MNSPIRPSATEANAPQGGELIGKFRLDRSIGVGGFGEVWRAQEEIEGQPVGSPCAIKLMRFETKGAGSSDNETFKATWVQEINALKSITHDAIPRTIDGGIDERTKLAFIAMELLEGETLAQRISRKRLGWRRALMIAERIASALDEAFAHGVVHRDLTPQNVFLLQSDRVCVIDWGIARLAGSPAAPIVMPMNLTSQGGTAGGTGDISTEEIDALAKKNLAKNAQARQQIVGTHGYIAPEVLEGDDPGAPVDAYALGVVLYQCMTGRLPYRMAEMRESTGSGGSTSDAARARIVALWKATVQGDLIPIEEWVSDIPKGVRELVEKLLSRDPKARGTGDLATRITHVNRFPHGMPNPPYAGLDAFGADRAGFLFGRDAHVKRLVKRLEQERALVLSGPSGCGKSSLAVAGVAAHIDRALLDGTDGWRLFVVRPSELNALELITPTGLTAGESKDAPLGTMVVVDQLEEVLSLEGEQQDVFCQALAELASTKRSQDVMVHGYERLTVDMRLRVIATVRDDFEWQVVRIESLRHLCETSRCLVTGVDATSARELVEEPAKALGYRLGDGDKAVREVEKLLATDPTALPIVQFALTEWWTRRDEGTKELPATAWQELGGVEGALSYVADRYYRKLSEGDQQVLRDLFGRLLLGDRKQWVSAASLGSNEERQLMNQLAELRLVRRRDEGEGLVGYELAHESLARRWNILKQWISERAADDALIADLEMDAKLWMRQGRPNHRLQPDLVIVEGVRKRLGSDALAYVETSQKAGRASSGTSLLDATVKPPRRPASPFPWRRLLLGFWLVPLLLITWVYVGYVKNNSFTAATRVASAEAGAIRRSEPFDIAKLDKLDALVKQLKAIDTYRENRSWLYYPFQGTSAKLLEEGTGQYGAILLDILARPVKARLEERLGEVTGAKYLEEYNDLKTYLLLADENKVRLLPESETNWETGRLLQLWTDTLHTTTDMPEADLKAKLIPHVKYYVDLLRRGVTSSETLDKALVERTRDILARVGPSQRLYDRFVTHLEYEKYDENGSTDKDNMKYPAISLDELFSDRREVLGKVRSAQKERTGKWLDVRGPYTAKGHAQVVASLEEGLTVLDRERWVVPLTQEEELQGDKIQQALARVRQDYDMQYIREWVAFFRDVQVEVPPNNKVAIEEFRVLSTPDWPYLRLLRVLQENTLFDEVEKPEEPALKDVGQVNHVKAPMAAKTGTISRAPRDPIPDKFRSMVRFGIPAPGGASAPIPLARYIEELAKVMTELAALQDRRPSPGDAAKATATAETGLKQARMLSLTMDETGQDLFTPLLVAPFQNILRINRESVLPTSSPRPSLR